MIGYLIAVAGLIILSAFFSAAEMSYSSANLMRLENAMENGSRRARAAVLIEERYDDALSTILIGNNLANIAISSVASVAAILLAGEEWIWLATLIVTILVIVFGETMPKIIAKKNANRLALSFAYFIRVLMILMKPVVFVVVGLTRILTLPMRGEKQDDSGAEAAVEELHSIIETAEDEAVLDGDRSELIQAALEFSEISASEAMTARVDMVAVDIDDEMDEILSLIDSTPFSRLPVYEGGIDNIIGFLDLNHFLKAVVDNGKPDIRGMLMPPLYVYKTVKLPQVLTELRKAKKHLAIVTDEYGGTLGVISMEDVLEQIVGDIWDETDEVEDEVVQRGNGEYELDGDMSISDFCELLDISEDAFDYESETVGGWTLEMFGGFPEEGYSFLFGDLMVTVLKMEGLRVEKVLITHAPPKTE